MMCQRTIFDGCHHFKGNPQEGMSSPDWRQEIEGNAFQRKSMKA